jgi:protein TonB
LPEKKDPPYILLFLLLSLLFHILLAWHFRYWQPAAKALEELRKKQKKEIPVQIIDLPPQPKKKTPQPPPKKPRFLADRNQRTKQETRAKESAPPAVRIPPKPPAPKPRPAPKAKPKPAPKPPEPKKIVKSEAKSKPLQSQSGLPVTKPVKKAKKPAPKPKLTKKPLQPQKEKPTKKARPDIKKLFPSFNELTKFDRERRRQAPPGPNRPHLPGKLKRDTEISLNTLDYKFHSYYLALKRKIELVWEYPYQARRTGLQGRLLIRFVINQDGSLADVRILRSSGSGLLDGEAVRAIRNASPFPPLPKRMNTEPLPVTAPFEYLLSYRSGH